MTNKIVNFISDDMFEKAKPGLCLLDFLVDCIKSFPAEIEKLTAIALSKFKVVLINKKVPFLVEVY